MINGATLLKRTSTTYQPSPWRMGSAIESLHWWGHYRYGGDVCQPQRSKSVQFRPDHLCLRSELHLIIISQSTDSSTGDLADDSARRRVIPESPQ